MFRRDTATKTNRWKPRRSRTIKRLPSIRTPKATRLPPSAMGNVDDQEIDQTLQPYGQWVEIPGYGRVWRPDPTVVGEDFTPYESAGTWVDSDAGWTFACDWDWGWLPFHYGRWDWFGGYWGWVPGHNWGPAWVEWRHGGGYVGWRPLRPNGHGGVIDHRSNWRFTRAGDFGRGHIRGHLANPAEGLRVTSPVGRLPLQGTRVAASSVMHGRYTTSPRFNASRAGTINRGAGGTVRSPGRSPSYGAGPTYRPPARTYSGSSHSSGSSSSHSSGSSSHSSSSHSSSGGGHSSGGGGHHR